MAVGVVEFLEVIHITHRQHIIAPQTLHALIERPTAGQAGELVAKGHLISLVSDGSGDHQHDLAAENVEGEGQDERFRQRPEQTQQTDDLCGMQRSRLFQVLPDEHGERQQKHRVRQLDQAHPRTVQRGPANIRQPHLQFDRVTLLQPQRHAAHRNQHRKPRDQILEQVGALLPRSIKAEQYRQQQADQMEDDRGILAHLAVVTVKVGLGVEKVIGDIHRDHQKQLALAPVNTAIRTAQQQHQCRQHVEQRSEKHVEVFYVRSRKPRHQQAKRRQKMTQACS